MNQIACVIFSQLSFDDFDRVLQAVASSSSRNALAGFALAYIQQRMPQLRSSLSSVRDALRVVRWMRSLRFRVVDKTTDNRRFCYHVHLSRQLDPFAPFACHYYRAITNEKHLLAQLWCGNRLVAEFAPDRTRTRSMFFVPTTRPQQMPVLFFSFTPSTVSVNVQFARVDQQFIATAQTSQ